MPRLPLTILTWNELGARLTGVIDTPVWTAPLSPRDIVPKTSIPNRRRRLHSGGGFATADQDIDESTSLLGEALEKLMAAGD